MALLKNYLLDESRVRAKKLEIGQIGDGGRIDGRDAEVLSGTVLRFAVYTCL